MSSNFGQIPPPTPELCALARLKNCCEHSIAYIFDWINLILAGNEDMHESLNEFKFRPDTTTNSRVMCPCTSEKLLWTLYRLHFWLDLLHFFQVTRDTQQVWTEFECWPDGTKGCRVIALDRCQKLFFAQYLENGWTEFNQILDTLYYWQDLYCDSKASFFANLQRSYSPRLISEIGFCSISWEKMDRIQPNFVYTLSSTRSI